MISVQFVTVENAVSSLEDFVKNLVPKCKIYSLGGQHQGGLDKKLLLSQQFKYSMRLFEAKTVSFC